MKIADQRILIFGDSLSVHGNDNAPEIWDVDQGSNRITSQPGDLLASLLKERGAQAVRVDANVGRSAYNFWAHSAKHQRTSPQDLLASDRAFAPTQVIVMLGTNDLELSEAANRDALTRLRDAFAAMGNPDVWVVGPPVFSDPSMTAKAARIYTTLAQVFGADRVIDARLLSTVNNRARDGVHFQSASAQSFARAILNALTGLETWTDESAQLPDQIPQVSTQTRLRSPQPPRLRLIAVQLPKPVSAGVEFLIGVGAVLGLGGIIYATTRIAKAPVALGRILRRR